jgi:hypothetical protein
MSTLTSQQRATRFLQWLHDNQAGYIEIVAGATDPERPDLYAAAYAAQLADLYGNVYTSIRMYRSKKRAEENVKPGRVIFMCDLASRKAAQTRVAKVAEVLNQPEHRPDHIDPAQLGFANVVEDTVWLQPSETHREKPVNVARWAPPADLLDRPSASASRAAVYRRLTMLGIC